MRRAWPGSLLDRYFRLDAESEAFLDVLDRLPQTFCHQDAFTKNLLLRPGPGGEDETVAVDWAFAGIAPVGADLASLVATSAGFFSAEPDQLGAIEALAFDGYVAGLRDAGWHGDERLVRLGYTATAALRHGLTHVGIMALDPRMSARLERAMGHPIEEILDRWALLQAFLHDRADEARRLFSDLEAAAPR